MPGSRDRWRLRERYCSSGAFIACPLFRRVEEGLVQADRLRAGLGPERLALES